jgi:galactose oxidase
MSVPIEQLDQEVTGKWGKCFPLPTVAIHAHLLSNGKVMFWGRRAHAEDSLDIHQTSAFILNSETHEWSAISHPQDQRGRQINLFCSGHSFLPDGRLFVAGGHYYDAVGLNQACTYDHVNDKWQALEPMNEGRWYPTCVELSSGAMLTFSGSFEFEILLNGLPQVWMDNKWNNLPTFEEKKQKPPLYPRMHLMPNGKIFMSGPLANSFVLDTIGTDGWKQVATRTAGNRDYAPSVEYKPGQIVFIGGGNDADVPPGQELRQPTNIVETIDLNQPDPKWTTRTPMNFRRRQHNATLLPDGTVLVTGGTKGGGGPQKGFNDLRPGMPVHVAEVWEPDSDKWMLVGSECVDRCYHGINLLLLDGSVLSAGGGEYRPKEIFDTVFKIENDPKDSHRDAQIFYPSYFFRGTRPTIQSAPKSIQPAEEFTIECTQSKLIKKVTLIKTPSVTHSFNQSQGVIDLPITGVKDISITAKVPEAPLFAPGFYMLFVLNDERIPSEAVIIQVGATKQLSQVTVSQPVSAKLLIKSASPPPAKLKSNDAEIDVEVGLTPTCPYGLAACWGAAYEALSTLPGALNIGDVPDPKACTAQVIIDGAKITEVYDWRQKFEKIANASYEYRGIELTIVGVCSKRGIDLYIELKNGERLLLQPIQAAHKIQWDAATGTPVALEEEEKVAFVQLQQIMQSLTSPHIRVVGPSYLQGSQPVVEVRQFVVLKS